MFSKEEAQIIAAEFTKARFFEMYNFKNAYDEFIPLVNRMPNLGAQFYMASALVNAIVDHYPRQLQCPEQLVTANECLKNALFDFYKLLENSCGRTPKKFKQNESIAFFFCEYFQCTEVMMKTGNVVATCNIPGLVYLSDICCQVVLGELKKMNDYDFLVKQLEKASLSLNVSMVMYYMETRELQIQTGETEPLHV